MWAADRANVFIFIDILRRLHKMHWFSNIIIIIVANISLIIFIESNFDELQKNETN